MKIVNTGSLGNISKPLTEALLAQGHQVTVISTKPEKISIIEALGATAAIGTLEDVHFITQTFKGADAVYCMLPPFDYFDPKIDVMAEAGRLARNYVQAIESSGVKRVIHLSSIGAHLATGNGLLAFHHLAETIFRELPEDISITHMRPTGFYNNLFDFKDMIKGKGILGLILAWRYYGFWHMIQGKTGVIAANYGADDSTVWVSPKDIAVAITDEITTPFYGRRARYIASDELTCNEVARTIGTAIGKPYLKWALMSDSEMMTGLKMFGIPKSRAKGIVEMNAGVHAGLVDADYYLNRPEVMGKIKMTDFAKDFAAAIQK